MEEGFRPSARAGNHKKRPVCTGDLECWGSERRTHIPPGQGQVMQRRPLLRGRLFVDFLFGVRAKMREWGGAETKDTKKQNKKKNPTTQKPGPSVGRK